MPDIVARLRRGSKHFETIVDLDSALRIRKGESKDVGAALRATEIFYNSKDGSKASQKDLQDAFETADLLKVAEQIIKKGEIEIPKQYRDEEREKKKKQVIEWYVKNAVDAKTGRPFTPQIISSALDQTGINITSKPIEQQVSVISEQLSKILPIKIETKKLSITIPAAYTGKAYGVVNEYKEKEDWLGNGDLKAIVNIPLGLQSEFYDKLNAITHGAALSEEIRQPQTEQEGGAKQAKR